MSYHQQQQQYYGYQPPAQDYSPLRENYILKVDDIPGAKPKQGNSTKYTQHYQQRLANNNPFFENSLAMQEKLYQSGTYHYANGPNPFTTAKKHYNVHHESEIAKSGVMQGRDGAPQNLNYVDFPRNLTTEDIPGAAPGTLQSKAAKNHELAQKLRAQQTNNSVQLPSTHDTLDHFQRQQQQQANPETPPYRYNHSISGPQSPVRNSNNFHHGQYSPEQPRGSAQEQYYSQQQQEKNYNQYEQTPLEDRRAKHVVFKDEPPREEPVQYREQPNQYREQPRGYDEMPPQYRDQPPSQGYEQDYLDSYVAKNTAYNQLSLGGQGLEQYQNSPVMPGSKQGQISKRDHLDQIDHDFISQQQALEKKVRETTRGRGFNIISNNATSSFQSPTRRAYGSSIKGMIKNTEDTRKYETAGMPRGWNTSNIQSGTAGQNYTVGDVAGGMNEYNETNYRYANKPGQGAPLQQDQYYGGKALKNMSGVRLY